MTAADHSVRGSLRTRLAMSPAWLALATSLWLASVGNIALWRALWRLPEVAHWQGISITLGFLGLIAALQTALLALFTWRWTFKPAIILCLIIAALGANFMLTYGVVIDKSMIVNV